MSATKKVEETEVAVVKESEKIVADFTDKKLNLYQKINEVKKVIKTFTKDKETEGYGSYSYISGTQILSAIKEKMEELQLLLLPVATEHQHTEIYNYKNNSNKDKTDFIVQGKIVYEWIDAENPVDRQKVDWQYYGQQNDISKAFGSGLTYSERYILLKSLGVPTDDEDPDARNEDKAQTKPQSKTPENKPVAPAAPSKYNQASAKAKEKGLTMAQVTDWIKKKYKKSIAVNMLSDEQFDELMGALENIGNE